MSRRFAENLKIIRKAFGKKQTDVAEDSNINYRHYQNLESNDNNVKISTAVQIAEVFGIPVCNLFQENIEESLLKVDICCTREIVDQIPVGILIVGRAGRILFGNNYFWINLTSFNRTHFLGGIFVWDLLWGDDKIKLREKEKFLTSGKPSPMPQYTTYVLTNAQNRPVNVKIVWSPISKKRDCLSHYVLAIIPLFD